SGPFRSAGAPPLAPPVTDGPAPRRGEPPTRRRGIRGPGENGFRGLYRPKGRKDLRRTFQACRSGDLARAGGPRPDRYQVRLAVAVAGRLLQLLLVEVLVFLDQARQILEVADLLFHFLAGLEGDHVLRRHVHLVAGARV